MSKDTLEARQLAEFGNLCYENQWSLATSSNYSALFPDNSVLISRSGVDKKYIAGSDFMQVDMEGKALAGFEGLQPSAETELHCHLYRLAQSLKLNIRAVLHTHSKFSVYFSRKFKSFGKMAVENFELLKIFESVKTHQARLEFPIFNNSQVMSDITSSFEEYCKVNEFPKAYLIEGHGIYTWAETIAKARYQLEAIEQIFEILYMEGR